MMLTALHCIDKMPCYRGRTARCRCKFRYVLKFTAASRGFQCDSNAFELNNSTNHSKITELNSLSDSHSLHCKHQRPFKMLKFYIAGNEAT